MTRRIVKNLDLIEDVEDGIPFFADEYGDWHKTETRCPYGFKDDLLYVRETWNLFLNDKGKEGYTRLINFPADNSTIIVPEEHWKWWDEKEERGYLNRPSIHLPKWASRIWLKVKNIRVERLQDISEEDAEKEGVDFIRYYPDADETLTAKELFMCLWDSINGNPRKNGVDISWNSNCWVWAVSFERIKKEGEK